MNSTALMPVEDFLRLTGKPNSEYREGEVTAKATPTKLHSFIQFVLQVLLKRQGVQPWPELSLRVTEHRFLVPDVVVADDFPGPYPTEPVLLCCEILSPEDRLVSMLAKCEEYHTWGVPYCWVIDPVKRTAWQYHLGQDPAPAPTDLRAGRLVINLAELFSELPNRE